MLPRHRARLWVQALEDRRTPATFTVSNTADSGAGSLRQAIADANNAAGSDTIVFDGSSFAAAQTISLLTTLPTITDDVTITGPGSGKVNVTRGSASNFRILKIENNSAILNVAITGMTFSNGALTASSQTDNGGGLYVGNENVSLTDVVVSNCTSNAQGGGIAAAVGAHLTMVNCTVSGNAAQGSAYGDPQASGFSGVGGGVYFTQDGVLTMTGCTISGNTAKYRGGGVYLFADSAATGVFRNCTFSGNKTTAVWSGTFIFYAPQNGGAGLSVSTNPGASSANMSLTVQNCTIYQNTNATGSTKGGGILATSGSSNTLSVSIESTVVSGNLASGGTGADIFSSKAITITNSAPGTSTGYSIVSGSGTGDLPVGSNLMLGPLADNGGPTKTHMPAFDTSVAANNSPLIDAGSNSASLGSDQRGLARSYDNPVVGSTKTVDIGAVEAQPVGLPIAAGNASDVTTTGATSYQVKVTYSGNTAISVSSIGLTDITVSGPASYTGIPTAFSIDVNSDGTPRVVTYTFTPPGGSWQNSAAGSYSIVMNANEVKNTSNLYVPSGAIGSFVVALPRTITVSNAKDSGAGSLRQAILDANNIFPSQDIIVFSSLFNTPQTITLTTGPLTISDSVKIQGPGTSLLTISGNFASRHMIIDGPGVLNVEISGMTLTQGKTSQPFNSERGGSVLISGENVTFDNVILTSNQAAQADGGAIHLVGQAHLVFKNGQITSNASHHYDDGMNGVAGGVGGAISAIDSGHSIVISNSIIAGNSADYFGGAIYSVGGGTVTIDGSSFNSNTTTVYLDALQTGGGAIAMGNGDPSGTLTITNSTFNSNQTIGHGGALLINGQPLGAGDLIQNSTFVFNKAETTGYGTGGAMLIGNLQGSPVVIQNCTIAYNQARGGGGLFVGNNDFTGVSLKSTIIAQNSATIDPGVVDADGPLYAEYSLIGIIDGIGTGLDPSSHDNLSGTVDTQALDPNFGSLDNNGGTTQTLPLNTGSAAIDTGDNAANLLYDQRGVGYPRVSGAKADIGAYELQVVSPPTVTGLQIDDGTAQRSMIRSLTITFSEAVTFSGSLTSAITLNRDSAPPNVPGVEQGGVTGLVNLTAVQSGGNTVTLMFANTGSNPVFGVTNANSSGKGYSLPDGRYTLSIDASQVTGNVSGFKLDGDFNSTAGGNYVLASAAGPATPTNIFRMFGDINGDGAVGVNDFSVFRGSFNSTNPYMDYNDDGSVSTNDFIQFKSRFNSSVP
jgi:hypothetical protein